jgi:hypothetical protein
LSQSSVLAQAAACEGSSPASLHHTSGQQVITPSMSEQQPAPAGARPQQPLQQQHATASTNVTTSLLAVVSPATLDGTTASSNSAAAARGSVDGTGCLQLVPLRGGSNSSGSQRQRQPQQQAGTPAAAPNRAATVDCAAVGLAAAGSSGNKAAEHEHAVRLASSDGATDASRSQHGAAARVLRAFGSAGPLHSGSPLHQQQHHSHDLGGLRRHLLGSWWGSRRKSSDELHASGNSSILLPPQAQATTRAAGGGAAGSSSPADALSSGATASGGAEAATQQQQKQPGLARHARGASQGRLSGDSDHSHNKSNQSREARPPAEVQVRGRRPCWDGGVLQLCTAWQQAWCLWIDGLSSATLAHTCTHTHTQTPCSLESPPQVWIILELCAGGTLMDAVLSGRLHTEGRLDLVGRVLQL